MKVNITHVYYTVDIETACKQRDVPVVLNSIARIELEAASDLYFDYYTQNKLTGSFILIDPDSNATVAAGFIQKSRTTPAQIRMQSVAPNIRQKATDIRWHASDVTRQERSHIFGHSPLVLWFTGLSGSGKSTLAAGIEKILFEQKRQVVLLDGDNLRHGLNKDLGFSKEERQENIRRTGEVAKILFEHGHIVLCSLISPYQSDRALVRQLFPVDSFVEIYVACSLPGCIERDTKGLYKKSSQGRVAQLTGVDAIYEAPQTPELVLDTELLTLNASLDAILQCVTPRMKL